MENKQYRSDADTTIIFKVINGLLLIITLILSIIAFFSIQDILLTIAASYVIDPTDITVQAKYTLSTVRNVWLMVGGCFLLAFFIIGIDYHPRRLGKRKTRKVLLITLAIELVIIGIRLII